MKYNKTNNLGRFGMTAVATIAFALSASVAKESPRVCNRTIKARVIALDQPWMWNRLGAAQPGGMLYALARDVVTTDGQPLPADPQTWEKYRGKVRLRDGKRPRPLVLRANKGDCLEVTFWNLLAAQPAVVFGVDRPTSASPTPTPPSVTRWAGIHAAGMELMDNITSDSSWVGRNPNSLAGTGPAPVSSPAPPATTGQPPAVQVYKWFAAEEGTFLIYSPADMENGSYQTREGLFGAIHVEPQDAEWYRSQVTHEDLEQATQKEDDLRGYARSLQPPAVVADPPEGAERPVTKDVPPAGYEKKTLVSTVQDKRTSVEVYRDSQGRIHTSDRLPMINYHALRPVDPTNKNQKPLPVLQMLAVNELNAPFYDAPLKEDSAAKYTSQLRDLDAGIIPKALRDIFKEKNRELSPSARATEQNGYNWLITDEGKAYSVKAKPPTDKEKGQLTLFDAELELVASDLTAIITGPNAGRFPYSNTSPTFRVNPASPDRRQPYREYTIIYHQAFYTAQSFAQFRNFNLVNAIQPGADNFAINYGSAAIGPEVIANRLRVGPMGNADAVDLKFEEFFLSAWAVGDPAMVVDVPANAPNSMVELQPPSAQGTFRSKVPPGSVTALLAAAQTPPQPRPLQNNPAAVDDFAPHSPGKATKAFFPDDPSNVYHSYMSDHVKFRILHAGPGPSHVHHLHAHQWLRSPDSDNGHYLDSQLIVPGSAFTLEITYNGSGNRNKTVGDAIFHCHFYPHFAQGMWALWRVHDVFEEGTLLDDDGKPKAGVNRALPDGEIERGTLIPAIVPLPTLGMAPLPARVELTDLTPWKPGEGQGRRVKVLPEQDGSGKDLLVDGKPVYKNPGYPFFIPGVSGHRPPHPPLDFAWLENPDTGEAILYKDQKIFLDGGLPRHLVLGGTIGTEYFTRWDFTKDADTLFAFGLPEDGTPVEKVAMQTHATRTRPTSLPNGDPGTFTLNGLPPTPGAPFADPGVTDEGNSNFHRRRYQGAVFQLDTTLNKKGWHYPQQRMISLWQDVAPTINNERPPQPFFFRTNTNDSVQFWHTNLLPAYYELDDFQVRTPTDIVGQHIHLVKFDVTASDGAANGFNYEDGTLAPADVQDRINAIKKTGGLMGFDEATGFVDPTKKSPLTLKAVKDYYPPPGSKVSLDANGVPVVTKDGKPTEVSVFGPPPVAKNQWDGTQTTIQLWDVDPLINDEGVDRTLRTVFTHDHFGPSTHQQIGLYAGMVVEPENSEWFLPDGKQMSTRSDGGPTSWNGYVVTEDPRDSYREFMLEFQDMQLGYKKGPPKTSQIVNPGLFDPNKNPKASAAFDLAQAYMPITNLNKAIANGAVAYYVEQLIRETLPTGGKREGLAATIPGFPEVFRSFGVPLSDKATVKTTQKDREWTITEAAGVPNAGKTYIVRWNGKQQIPLYGVVVTAPEVAQLLVYTPDLDGKLVQPALALNPPSAENDDPQNANNSADTDPTSNPFKGAPFPQLVSQNQIGTYSLNYRNEPLPFRFAPPPGSPTPAPTPADLTLAYSSIPRSDQELNAQPKGTPQAPKDSTMPRYPAELLVPNTQGTDPFTPLLEAYANDRIQIRTLVGAHTQSHAFQVQGTKWLYEPESPNSGYVNAQLMGLSEHFEMIFDLPNTVAAHPGLKIQGQAPPPFADYFYSASSDIVGLNNGLWGIMRGYGAPVPGVMPLPNNSKPGATPQPDIFEKKYMEALAAKANHTEFEVVAITAKALPGGTMLYNNRDDASRLQTPDAVLYVRAADFDFKTGKLRPGVPVEPLILRAAAGDWIKVTLYNALDGTSPIFSDPQNVLYATPFFNNNPESIVPMTMPNRVGLHPQLVAYDAVNANGVLVGFNPQDKLVPPPGSASCPAPSPGGSPVPFACRSYYWYAGEVKQDAAGAIKATPIEFGATNLTPADQLLQPQFGMVGALIIEPENSTWVEDVSSRASAVVSAPNAPSFREFVVINQNFVANSAAKPSATPSTGPSPKRLPPNTVATTSIGAVNFRSEPFSVRGISNNSKNLPQPAPQGDAQALSNSLYSPPADPQTPVFVAPAGMPTRFRLVIPSGVTSNAVEAPPVFIVHGHHWQEEPYTDNSTKLGDNRLSKTLGATQAGPYQKFDLLFPSAGGAGRVPGDYLYATYQTAEVAGTWGLFRVTPHRLVIEKATFANATLEVSGTVQAATTVGGAAMPKNVQVSIDGVANPLGTTTVSGDGKWTFKWPFKSAVQLPAPTRVQVAVIGDDKLVGATSSAVLGGR
jgi:hypothetical protein